MTDWKVLTLNEFDKWLNLLEECDQPDIHCNPKFMKLFEKKMKGEAKLFVWNDPNDKNFIIYPFYKRRINDLKNFSTLTEEYFDIVSPWYCGGPVMKSVDKNNEILEKFVGSFNEFTNQEKIITEFTNINPLFKITEEYVKIINGIYQYDVYSIDLTQDVERIWERVKVTHRRNIKSAERKKIRIEFSFDEKILKTFHEFYKNSMQRLQATEFYNFSLEFLKEMKTDLENNFIISTAIYEEKPIAQAIFLFQYGICYYWLGAYDFELRNMHANHLLFYKTILWAKEKGNKIFYFGGGRNESLRKYKLSFGSDVRKLYSRKAIFNEKVYLNLVETSEQTDNESDFFPKYRNQDL